MRNLNSLVHVSESLIARILDSSFPEERDTAAGKLRLMLSQIAKMPHSTQASPKQASITKYEGMIRDYNKRFREFEVKAAEQSQRIEQLEAENQKLSAEIVAEADARAELSVRIKKLDAENRRLEAALQANDKIELLDVDIRPDACSSQEGVSDLGTKYVQFDKLRVVVDNTFSSRRWKGVVALHLGISRKCLDAWEVVGVVPDVYVDRARAMTDNDRKPASRKPWSQDELECLEASLARELSDLQIAGLITQKYGRKRLESSVVRQRCRLQREGKWRPPTNHSPTQPAQPVHAMVP